MQGALNFGLPRQSVYQLVQAQGGCKPVQRFAVFVEQLQVGDEPERVAHGNHALLQLDPIPGDAGGALVGFVAPQGLAAAKASVVAEVKDVRAEVRQLQLGRATGLPQ